MRLIIVFLSLISVLSASAQKEVKYCGQVEATEWLFQHYPQQRQVANAAFEQLQEEARNFEYGQQRSGSDPYIIPIVFHVIHNNGPENISDEQIFDAVEILNRDLRKQNPDTLQIAEEFVGIAADTEIEFRLAQLDPEGNCTKGITRTVSPLTYEGNGDMKDLIIWPRDMYLNVWVCAYANGAAGYTYLPSSVDGWWGLFNDGIVLKHDYTGSIGTSSAGSSRTLTHEVGHWLNLLHAWGQGNSPGNPDYCGDFGQTDYVDDTPKTIGWTSCAVSGESCGTLDNVQNYMEYSYCSRMFTEGQRDRMHAALESSVADRNELWQQSNLQATGVLSEELVLCAAEFTVNRSVVCVGEEVSFTDGSFSGPTSWTWEFGDGNSLTGSDESVQNPVYTYTEPGTYSVSLTVGNGLDEVSTTETNLITVLPMASTATPFAEGFEDDSWMEEWFVYNPSDDQQWNDVSTAAYSGERSLRLNNNYNNLSDNYDWFESKTFDASGQDTVYLGYKWAYVNRLQQTDDRLRIYVSGDCGQSWSIRELHRGFTDLPTDNPTNINWTPSGTGDWSGNTIIIDEAGFLTDGLRFKFEFQAKGGNNIYIDDINIFTPGSVGIEDLRNLDFNVNLYPNPSEGQATLEYQTLTGEDVRVLVYDTMGRVVLNRYEGPSGPGTHQIELDLASERTGMYMVEIQGKTQVKRLPLVLR